MSRGLPSPDSRATADDRALVRAAVELLRRRYVRGRHTVAAAVRTRSRRVFLGVNIEGIHAPCAEPVAVGAAFTAGDVDLEAMVAVRRRGRRYPVLAPCGNCRQLLIDYAPGAYFLVPGTAGSVRRLSAREGLPAAFLTFDG